jgi:D-alanine-D-alanine ligase
MTRFAVVHNAIAADAPPDEMDVLIQAEAVCRAVVRRKDVAELIPCSLDLGRVKQHLEEIDPDMVFNLVESLEGQGRLIHLFPSLLEAMAMPFTGSGSMSILLSSNKPMAKKRLQMLNLPTPPWIGPLSGGRLFQGPIISEKWCKRQRWLMKSAWEHASVGLDDQAVIFNKSPGQILEFLGSRAKLTNQDWFCEPYIDGREFNLSILGGLQDPTVLPPAEIVFEGFPENRLKILGYTAKWDPSSFEYRHTLRRFEFPDEDSHLLRKLEEMALKCWNGFDLNGYARVDFRVDADGRPWILEINANPCLSPDAGFAAALEYADIGFSDAVYRIVADAKRKSPVASMPDKDSQHHFFSDHLSSGFDFRYEVLPGDVEAIGRLTRKTGFFRDDEIETAKELVSERLAKGPESGYEFIFVVINGQILGYACFGPIACTVSSYDLYWIAVSPEVQKQGIGRKLLCEAERVIREAGGSRVYVETSHQDLYASTRLFYERCGYCLESVLNDFYAPGDGRATYCKKI